MITLPEEIILSFNCLKIFNFLARTSLLTLVKTTSKTAANSKLHDDWGLVILLLAELLHGKISSTCRSVALFVKAESMPCPY